MSEPYTTPESDFRNNLKWLMFFRVLFTSLLLGSTIILQLAKNPSPLDTSLLVLYGLIIGIFLLSFIYSILLQRIVELLVFTYVQIIIDTCVVSLIILVTGSFSSIFTFLYLVVITYSSLFLLQRGNLIIAAISAVQYGIMVNFEFYGIFKPFLMEGSLPAFAYPWSHVLYKVLIIMVACFAVAYLSGVLAEQVRKTKIELETMEEYVKRVEKMAYMGRMAANMAHEIKNPLASLAGSIQMLKEDMPYNPDHDKLMKIVLRETGRLSELVSNFLLFAKPTVGKVESFELNRAISETVGLFEKDKTCRERIDIRLKLSPDIWVKMDPLHLKQVLWNLLLNSAEAIEGSGEITIEAFKVKSGFAAVRISDNGRGMPKKIVHSVFDPFFTTKPHGTGLGLSIVHSILESYGSRLEVASDVGKGTVVTLKLLLIEPAT